MIILFLILLVLAAGLLGVIVLIQNPKGGGLSGTFGGFGNQVMGVKQTTDVLEKGTWLFAGILGVLCIVSVLFINSSGTSSKGSEVIKGLNTNSSNTAPATQQPVTTPPDTSK